mgnify:CR=1 FL=1
MYLFLAFGIIVAVLFVGGAVGGFIAGFVDGINDAPAGTSSPAMYGGGIAVVLVTLWTVAIQWTFLGNRFASYTLGLIPRDRLWLVSLMAFIAFWGLNMLEKILYDPLADCNPESLEIWQWIATHRWQAALLLIPVDVTYMLVLYGAVFREIVEWKPNASPQMLYIFFSLAVTVPVFVIGVLMGTELMRTMFVFFMSVQVASMTYLCTRSVLPILIGSILADVLTFVFIDIHLTGWYFILAAILMIAGVWGIWKTTEAFRPID